MTCRKSANHSLAGRSNVMDSSFQLYVDNNIREDESEAESTWVTLRTSLITHYKYAKLQGLLQLWWITYKQGQNSRINILFKFIALISCVFREQFFDDASGVD